MRRTMGSARWCGILVLMAMLSGARAEAPSPDQRAARLLAAMTPAEKLSLLIGQMPPMVPVAQRPADMLLSAGYVPGIPRLGIPPLRESDAGLGVANMRDPRRDPQGQPDTATALPSALSTAASFDPAIALANGTLIGRESRAKGFNVQLAGGVDLVREPRGGRSFEYFGEDPLLAGTMAGQTIRGIQAGGTVSTVKHYALNDQETGRHMLDARMDPAALRESDLLAFEIAIEIGHPGAVMCGYNRVNGAFACENDPLLNQVLKRDWHYPGWVMSDWGAVHSTRAAALAGLDQESGVQFDSQPFFGAALKDEVAKGDVPQARIDDMVRRILRSMAANGLLTRASYPPIDAAGDAVIAQRAAEQGIVLLRNRDGLLPLGGSVRTIAVIGAHADIGVLSGGGSSQVRPIGGPALELHLPDTTAEASWATTTYDPSSPLQALRETFPGARVVYDDGTDPGRAAALARRSDVVLLFAWQWMTEAQDVPDLSLPDNQDALIAAVAAANPRSVVVLETGGPVLMPWLAQVGAVLEAWYPGQRGGPAIARVLSGAIDPSGRLPVSFPARLADLPNPVLPGSDVVTYPEGAAAGYKWYDLKGRLPAFPFGFGLSYTQFHYSALRVNGLRASFTVTNTGKRTGSDTPQVYATPPGGAYRRLIGWRKVTLAPGASATVSIAADPRLVSLFDTARDGWALAGGAYRVQVGGSERDQALEANTHVQAAWRGP